MLEDFKRELAEKGSCSFYVKVRPGASQTRIHSVLSDQSVKIDIAAVAEQGKANAALLKILAEEFDVAQSCVSIVSGATARLKLVRVQR